MWVDGWIPSDDGHLDAGEQRRWRLKRVAQPSADLDPPVTHLLDVVEATVDREVDVVLVRIQAQLALMSPTGSPREWTSLPESETYVDVTRTRDALRWDDEIVAGEPHLRGFVVDVHVVG